MNRILYILVCFFACLLISDTVKAQCAIGETEVTIELTTNAFDTEKNWEVFADGVSISGALNGPQVVTFCVPETATISIDGCDTFGDGWDGTDIVITNTEDGSVNTCGAQDGCILASVANLDNEIEDCDVGINTDIITVTLGACGTTAITGCTDPAASNFNPCAATDDGSCLIPPANDECADAVALTINPDQSCAAVQAGTISLATDSGDNGGCFGTSDDDVWYSFVATNTTHTIDLLNVTGSTTDLYHRVTDNCVGGADLICSDPNNSIATGLVPGTTYYLQVYTWTGTAGQLVDFDICIGTPPPPPANNDCATAIPIAVEAEGACPAAEGVIDFFSAEPSGLVPSCSFNTTDFDVFFTATVPATGVLQIFTSSTTFDTPGVAIYDACGGTEIFCDSFIDSTPIALQAFAGQDVIIQFYDSATYTFNACVGTPPPPPANDSFEDAAPICGDIPTTGSNFSATTVADDYLATCIGSLENTVWFSFESDGNPIDIDVTETSCAGTSGLQVVLITGDPVNGFTEDACDDIDDAGLYELDFASPVSGQTYYIYIDGVAGEECNVEIIANSGAASCCGPEYSINTYCVPGDEANFYADFVLTDLGTDPSGYDVNGTAITAVGTYQFGPFPNGTGSINITGITEVDCIITEVVENDCACDPDAVNVTTPDATINAGDPISLNVNAGQVIPGGFLGYNIINEATTGCAVAPSDPGTVVDITASLGDDVGFPVTLPFTFNFYDNSFTNLIISSNGYITFGADGTDLGDDPIPTAEDPNDMIALFWDDLSTGTSGGVAYFNDVIGGVNCFVVTYTNVGHLGGGGTVTGQIIICEDETITITCLACAADNGTDLATQGIENGDGTEGEFDSTLTDGQYTAGGTFTNCVTFEPNRQVPSTCDTIGWVTDLMDIPGSLVSAEFNDPTLNPTVTTTYYAVVECNYFDGPTLTCVDEVTITVNTATSCTLTAEPAANIVCDDNGTAGDPDDDTYTFEITVNGDNTDPAASDSFTDSEGNIGTYGSTFSYGPYPISGGNITINFTDNDDPDCIGSMMAAAPATCSGATCTLTAEPAANIVCDDNGTDTDPLDDTYTFEITVNGNSTFPGASNSFVDSEGNSGTYGSTISYGPYPISGGNVTINFTDAETAACIGSMMATAPATCSDVVNGNIEGDPSDPCFCGNENNIMVTAGDDPENPFLQVQYFYDFITISTTPATNGLNITTMSETGILDMNGDPAVLSFNDNGDGTYTAEFYHEVDEGFEVMGIEGSDGAGLTVTFGDSFGECGQCATEEIPTLSEWGLITLALMLMSYGSIVMAGSGALAGANNVQLPISNFQLPFNAAILRKAFAITAVIAAIGYTLSIVCFGAIFFSDIIGVAIAGPVFAYLIHLLYLLESKK